MVHTQVYPLPLLHTGALHLGQPDLTPLVEASGGASSVKGSIWDSGEWWMLLAAQSMAVGTIMVRWVSKYAACAKLTPSEHI